MLAALGQRQSWDLVPLRWEFESLRRLQHSRTGLFVLILVSKPRPRCVKALMSLRSRESELCSSILQDHPEELEQLHAGLAEKALAKAFPVISLRERDEETVKEKLIIALLTGALQITFRLTAYSSSPCGPS